MKILFCGFRLTFLMMLMLAALITCLRMTKGNLPDAETTPLLASQGSQNQSCEPQGIHEPSTKNHLLAVLIFFKIDNVSFLLAIWETKVPTPLSTHQGKLGCRAGSEHNDAHPAWADDRYAGET
ncbi:hypothetical protein CIHG_07985 [Coccidioides immitis H538.4]|uniref:Secreted protein n=3 Tax=Coccidioides immitis TaxID=5501 RepID=A0A0J8QRL3_COCIT|nr:hypothetical protein CIRG_08955 [Coccidioides immitis RMSCC 2394]KMU75131.1 hypothetical protein CISG_04418 [Coccidioides immitis RMSCC 3703]KMU90175.1 hypothetical protein CIHG_07985 [Coccidioides immitis H538.4]